jgi:hypothetical protein
MSPLSTDEVERITGICRVNACCRIQRSTSSRDVRGSFKSRRMSRGRRCSLESLERLALLKNSMAFTPAQREIVCIAALNDMLPFGSSLTFAKTSVEDFTVIVVIRRGYGAFAWIRIS